MINKSNIDVRNNNYVLSNKVDIVGKVIFISHDSFENGGGVFTYAIKTNGCRIHAKLFYRPFADIFKGIIPPQPFHKGDILSITGFLKENRYTDPETHNIVSKGCYIVIKDKGITYADEYISEYIRVNYPEIDNKKSKELFLKIKEGSRFVPKL